MSPPTAVVNTDRSPETATHREKDMSKIERGPLSVFFIGLAACGEGVAFGYDRKPTLMGGRLQITITATR